MGFLICGNLCHLRIDHRLFVKEMLPQQPGSTTRISPIAFSQLMTDPRYTKLANLLINYSTRVKKGDRVLLDITDVPDEMSVELLRAVRAAGGTPLIDGATPEFRGKSYAARMPNTLRSSANWNSRG